LSLKDDIQDWFDRNRNHPWLKPAKIYGRRLLIIGIILLIVFQLAEIGWGEVLRSLPVQPLFYIIFVMLFITLPTAEVLLYRQVWKVSRWETFKAFITKKVYNEEVMGYSGELYLFVWAKKRVPYSSKEIIRHIRDNNILSSLASHLIAVILVLALVYTDTIDSRLLFGKFDSIHIVIGILILIVIIGLVLQFRKHLFAFPFKMSCIIFSIYAIRFIVHHLLLMAQWAVVIPNTPVSVWFIFVAVIIVVNRIPFLPSKDLVFAWAGIELSQMMNMASANVAGMLLVWSVLNKISNLSLYMAISWISDEPTFNPEEDSFQEIE